MGFGSYDESEQESQRVDRDVDDETVERTDDYEGELAFEYGDASSDDLLETYEEIDTQ
ncbi:MAG: DUF5786 family protein [Natronomonas sp.]